ncbi:hypothetical protein BKA80DRAFT_71690 [Phyllosticta citrichinensis]
MREGTNQSRKSVARDFHELRWTEGRIDPPASRGRQSIHVCLRRPPSIVGRPRSFGVNGELLLQSDGDPFCARIEGGKQTAALCWCRKLCAKRRCARRRQQKQHVQFFFPPLLPTSLSPTPFFFSTYTDLTALLRISTSVTSVTRVLLDQRNLLILPEHTPALDILIRHLRGPLTKDLNGSGILRAHSHPYVSPARVASLPQATYHAQSLSTSARLVRMSSLAWRTTRSS